MGAGGQPRAMSDRSLAVAGKCREVVTTNRFKDSSAPECITRTQ